MKPKEIKLENGTTIFLQAILETVPIGIVCGFSSRFC
jgi:hypothetical protein